MVTINEDDFVRLQHQAARSFKDYSSLVTLLGLNFQRLQQVEHSLLYLCFRKCSPSMVANADLEN